MKKFITLLHFMGYKFFEVVFLIIFFNTDLKRTMIDQNKLAALRQNYSLKTLDEKSVDINPFKQFSVWFNEVLEAEITEPNAMILSTSNSESKPDLRTVLLKGFDEKGFVFYTNYLSQKAKALDENPRATLLFFWKELERQVRIYGMVNRTSSAESDEYFNSRPYESRIGAWVSLQSSVVPDRKYLEDKFVELKSKMNEQTIKRPEYWGGFRVIPSYFEFWQGRENRLHDRIIYELQSESWKIYRLSP